MERSGLGLGLGEESTGNGNATRGQGQYKMAWPSMRSLTMSSRTISAGAKAQAPSRRSAMALMASRRLAAVQRCRRSDGQSAF
jgi:hypothetical protein